MSSMKYPYRDLGVTFDRQFRNDLIANFKDIEHDIRMIGGEAAQQALEAAEEANTQAIYAQTSGDYANDKGDYAAQQGDYAKTQGDYAKAQGDYAKAQADYAKQVADENKTRLLTPVATFADIATTYPNPQHGDTVQTLDDGKFYRYENGQWKFKYQLTGTAISNIVSELTKQNQQSVTIGHGLNVINASQNSPLDIKIEGRTLVNVSQNVLDPAKYYVLADKKSKVKFADGTTYSGVAKFQGKAEKPILIRVGNFENKKVGDTTNNPHIAYRNAGGVNNPNLNTLVIPSKFSDHSYLGEFRNDADYALISTQNSQSMLVNAVGNGNMSQMGFSFNLIEAIERNVGKIPASDTAGKVNWLRNNGNRFVFRWYGFGSSVGGNKATIATWYPAGNTWTQNISHTSGTVTGLSITRDFATGDRVDSNGFVHFLAYAEPSDGVTPSTIYTDYVELEIELKPEAQLWNPRLPLYEVDATEYANILTVWDENEVMRRYPMVESVQHVQNPYVIAEGENLLPPFSEWNLHANARVKSPYELELNATATSQLSSVRVNVLPNTTYTASLENANSNLCFGVTYYDANGTILANQGTPKSGWNNTTNPSGVFTTPATCAYIVFYVHNSTEPTGTFTFKNPMLTLGSAAKPFVPRNPSMLLIDGVKLGAIGDKKDILWKDGQDWKVTKWIEKDVVLDGKLSWSFVNDQFGFKVLVIDNYISAPRGNTGLNTSVLLKPTGVPMKYGQVDPTDVDTYEIYMFNGTTPRVKLRLLDTDTGWGEHYKPSAQEIQAYFNGWKANGYTTGTAVTNELTGQLAPSATYTFAQNGAYRNVVVEKSTDGSTWSPAVENTDFKIDISGTKAVLTNLSASPLYFRISYNYGVTVNSWASLVDGSAPATNTLAYVSANMAPGFTPYKLSYVRSTPVTEVVTDKVEGDLIVNGATQVEVGSGVIIREKANPKISISGTTYHINVDSTKATPTGSELKNKTSQIFKVYKNSIEDKKWSIITDSSAFGKYRLQIPTADFDTTAEYTVTYLVLDRHLFTTNILAVTATYDSSLKSVVDSVVAKQSDLASNQQALIRSVAELYKRVKALGG
jgi:hypothetical protein